MTEITETRTIIQYSSLAAIPSDFVGVARVGNELYAGDGTTLAAIASSSMLSTAAQTIAVARHTTADTAGVSLTVTAGSATAAATNKAGGQLILGGGTSTGTGSSGVTIKGHVAGSSGTDDTTAQDMVKIVGNTLGFYNHAVAVQPVCSVSPLTTITHTAPGTPDYAFSDTINSSAWGFSSQDEANTLLKVVAALQAEIADLKVALRSNGTIAA
jgi:hypothetical protein